MRAYLGVCPRTASGVKLSAIRTSSSAPPCGPRRKHALAHWQPTFHAANGTSLKRVKSRNWSGYADDHSKGAKYSMVTGKWTEPTGKCGTAQSRAVF